MELGADPNNNQIEHSVALALWIALQPENTQTIKMARMLLRAEVKVDAPNKRYETAVTLASSEDQSTVRLLLEFGTNTNHRSRWPDGHIAIEAAHAHNVIGQQCSNYHDGLSKNFEKVIEMLLVLEASAHDGKEPVG